MLVRRYTYTHNIHKTLPLPCNHVVHLCICQLQWTCTARIFDCTRKSHTWPAFISAALPIWIAHSFSHPLFSRPNQFRTCRSIHLYFLSHQSYTSPIIFYTTNTHNHIFHSIIRSLCLFPYLIPKIPLQTSMTAPSFFHTHTFLHPSLHSWHYRSLTKNYPREGEM